MCGLLAIFPKSPCSRAGDRLEENLKKQSWRGPDHLGIWADEENRAFLGHNRLTILDDSPLANMPMPSKCNRFMIIFNGEIYNHLEIRKKFLLECKTHSDAETLLSLYSKIGNECVEHLEGMFAFVIFDKLSGVFFAARDQLGIKPLYYSEGANEVVFGSESSVINDVVQSVPSIAAIEEWKVFRRPLANKTFFEKIYEIPPGCIYEKNVGIKKYWHLSKNEIGIDLEYFKHELQLSVNAHLMNDYETVSLLSGGLDSAVILGLAGLNKAYTIGLNDNNEFEGAQESAGKFSTSLVQVEVTRDELEKSWDTLLNLRREPLGVPNEGLIFSVCKAMKPEEKVVLTGEGADELLFGYDKIFQWSNECRSMSVADFISRYSYAFEINLHKDTVEYVADMMRGKTPLEFMEDFFIEVHLPGLLRRMDAASMCASKEARVPFVSPKLFNIFYRQSFELRCENGFSKSPLRKIAFDMGLTGALGRRKIGFSATFDRKSQKDEYDYFQRFCLNKLGWS